MTSNDKGVYMLNFMDPIARIWGMQGVAFNQQFTKKAKKQAVKKCKK